MIRGYLLVSVSIIAFFGLFEFMSRAEDVGVGRFGTGEALFVTVLGLPALWVDLSPFIALVGIVYGLAELVKHSEITAMRSAGMSPLRLCAMCAAATLLFMAAVMVTELYARPIAQQAELRYMKATADEGSMYSASGVWTQLAEGYLHIADLDPNGDPQDIEWYAFNDRAELERALSAPRAKIQPSGAWLLEDAVERVFPALAATEHIEISRHERLSWRTERLERTRLYEIPLDKLELSQLREQGTDNAFELEFWHRALLPLGALVFVLFSASFILGAKPRRSTGGLVVAGIATAFVLYLVQQFVTNVIFLASSHAVTAVLAPLGAVLAIAFYRIIRLSEVRG